MVTSRLLPDEIPSCIFSHLNTREDKQTILALGAVDRQCNRLARPLVDCTIGDRINQHRHLNEPEVGPLQSAVWDIVHHPEFAPFVKSIQFDDWDFIGIKKVSPLPEGVRGPSPEEYLAALVQADLPDDVNKTILKQLSEETPAGHLSFLLATCRNLEVLKAPASYGFFGSLINRIFFGTNNDASQVALPPPPQTLSKTSLRSLRDLHFGGFNYDSAVRHIIPLLCLPNLHALHVHGLGDSDTWTDHTLPDLPKAHLNHNLISFSFDSSMVSGPGISRILDACEKPRSLFIRWRPGLWNEHLTHEPVGDALRKSGDKLEILHLDSTDVFAHRYRELPPTFGSFAPLKNLKTLAIPRFAFPKETRTVEDIVDILPANLEELYVLGVGNEKEKDGRSESEAFAALCNQAKEFLPILKKVVMVKWHHYHIEEWFGRVNHRCVDYETEEARDLGRKRIS